jgi:hypothetical protein
MIHEPGHTVRVSRRRIAAAAFVAIGAASVGAAVVVACEAGRLDAIEAADVVRATDVHATDAVDVTPPNTLTTDWMAYYSFDQGGGTVLLDESGHEHDGTITGGTWIADGRFAGALHFDGASYVQVPNFPNAPTSFSVSAWVRSTAPEAGVQTGFQTVASTEVPFDGGWQVNTFQAPDAGYLQGGFWESVPSDAGDAGKSGYIYADCYDYPNDGGPCLQYGVWTQIAFVFNAPARTFSLYINGTLHDGPTHALFPISPGTGLLWMGSWTLGGRLLVGDLDDMVIYGRALAPAEVMLLYHGPPTGPPD